MRRPARAPSCASRPWRWTIFLLLAAAWGSPLAGQTPDTPKGRRVAALVEALGVGGMDAILAFIDREYAPGEYSGFGGARGLAAYWASVAREVGPVEFHSLDTLRLGSREIEVSWLRGRLTRAWIGVRLDLEPEAPHRIVANGVIRGLWPADPPRPDPAAVGVEPFDPERLSDYLDGWLTGAAAADHFSGAILVARDGGVVFEGAYGRADRESGIRVGLDTRFRLASVTKIFTGVAIAQLAEAGKLSLGDPLSKFIPEYPRHIADQVTVHHLLTHTSGIELDDDADFNSAIRDARSLDQLLAAQLRYIERLNLGNYDDFAPLTEFDYTNEGIDLLGVIVERVSGEPWSAYLRRHIFDPAGMTDTGAHVLEPVPGLAKAYTARSRAGGWLPGTLREAETGGEVQGASPIRPAGSGWSTARDMYRFTRALRDGTLLSQQSYQGMASPQIDVRDLPGEDAAYGYTLDVLRRGEHLSVGHGGGAPGINTQVRWYPEEGWTLIVLVNRDRVGNHVLWHLEEVLRLR